MADDVPKWADVDLSSQLDSICEVGESATVEFKEGFPDQAHRLGTDGVRGDVGGAGQGNDARFGHHSLR